MPESDKCPNCECNGYIETIDEEEDEDDKGIQK